MEAGGSWNPSEIPHPAHATPGLAYVVCGLVLEGQRAYSPWFVRFVEELLRGNTKVAELMGPSPFPVEPPRFIRIELYHYQFTEGDVRRETGAWWTRKLLDNYTNTISLK